MASNASSEHDLFVYYPRDKPIAGLVQNNSSFVEILTKFFGATAVVLVASHVLFKTLAKRNLTGTEHFLYMWFICSGLIHAIFEGYFAWNNATMASDNTLLGQMWKEYAYSDSRYLTRDSFVVIMESITAACWGPGCLYVAYAILRQRPLRFAAAMLVSLGQLYGDVLYYLTAGFEGFPHSNPHPFYFYFYFVFMNMIWIVIPLFVIFWASGYIVQSQIAFDQQQQQQEASSGKDKKQK